MPLVRPAVLSFLEEELSIKVFQLQRDGPGRLRVPASELRTRVSLQVLIYSHIFSYVLIIFNCSMSFIHVYTL